jgi:tRNA threonylcarbamoyladenosine modification (KEOPS) complex Cgi121 subunit
VLKQLEEYGKFAEITGFRGVKVEDAKAFAETACKETPDDVKVQLFNADLIATWQHLYFSALNALSALKNKRNISKSLAMETALYASSQRQIKKAIDFIGLKPNTPNVAVLVLGGDADSVKAGVWSIAKLIGAEQDETVLELSEAKTKRIRAAFDVSDAEFEAVSSRSDPGQALVDLVVERVALLSTRL